MFASVLQRRSTVQALCMQAKAHEQLGQLLPREKHKQAYDESLKQRYKHLPEVKRILRHRHLPATIYKARALRSDCVR
jgi:DDB1- and CUL4-associated factor 13